MRQLDSPYKQVALANHFPSRAKTELRFLWQVVTGLVLFAGTANATPIPPAKSLPVIPVQIINTNAGRVMTAHAEEYDHTVYIGGLVYRPPSPGIGAHVHVWGVNQDKRTVWFKTTYVIITGKFVRSESYQISIAPDLYKKATIVYVTFHSQGDEQSKTEDY